MKTPILKITGPVHSVKQKDGVSRVGKQYQMTEVYIMFRDEYNGVETKNPIKFTFFGKAAEYAAAAKPGDVVEIEFQINGKVEVKNNEKYHYQNLNGRTFRFPEAAKPEPPKPTTSTADDYLSPDDDLPF